MKPGAKAVGLEISACLYKIYLIFRLLVSTKSQPENLAQKPPQQTQGIKIRLHRI
jgi:hypothetical protein